MKIQELKDLAHSLGVNIFMSDTVPKKETIEMISLLTDIIEKLNSIQTKGE